jgi:hypothetical protein
VSDAAQATSAEIRLTPAEVRAAMRTIYVAQVFGLALFMLLFRGGVLSLYALRIGASNSILGVLGALYEGSFLYSFFVSPWIARFGKLRWMITLLLAASVSSAGLFVVEPIYAGFGSGPALAVLLVVMFLLTGLIGTGMASWWPLLRDILPGELIGTFFGRLRTLIDGGGLLLVLGVSAFFGQQPALWKFLVVFAIGGLGQLGRALLLRGLPDPRGAEPAAGSGLRQRLAALKEPLVDWRFTFFCLVAFVLYAFISLPAPLFVPFLKLSRGFPTSLTVAGLAGLSMGSALSQIAWGRYADRHSPRLVFVVSCLPLALVQALLALAPRYDPALPWLSVALAGLCLALIGAGSAGFGMAYTAYLFQASPPQSSSVYMGLFTFLYSLGAIVGPLAGGFLADALAGVALPVAGATLDNYQIVLIGSGLALALSLTLLRWLPAGRYGQQD